MTQPEEKSDDCEPDQAWKALSLVNDWVKHAEAKSATILAASGVTGGVLFNLVKNQTRPGWWLTIFGILCGSAVILAGTCALLALTPRTGRVSRLSARLKAMTHRPNKPDPDTLDESRPRENGGVDEATTVADPDPSNLLFFAHIARDYADDSPTYTEVLTALTTDKKRLTEHIARQVHANAGVAHRKFRWAERAIRWLALALATLAGVTIIVGRMAGG
ncbi:DUF5706 domain-containing protein [Micromonospora lupini]|uniref:Pycsar system effector family protein n=1 Tax=Micromonospora lupini TaxID=285679 RepID=UPI00224F457F|nr:Pycsar system effector family protein [Micromonospora lupini]MCX5067699.1 DUF5706 domain-containing protein [Micromonospora lupini]